MYFKDSFTKKFDSEEEMLDFIDEIENRAKWKLLPANQLRVITAKEQTLPRTPEELAIYEDTMKMTGLMLACEGKELPMGETSIRTLLNRARISGTVLKEIGKEQLVTILNICLRAAKGKALVRIEEGKVRAVHAGDKGDYSVLDMSDVFRNASAVTNGDFSKVSFQGGFYDHGMTTALWEIMDEELFDAYRDEMSHSGVYQADMKAGVRVTSSNVGISGANISYTVNLGAKKIALGQTIRLCHRGSAQVKDFVENISQIFAKYKPGFSTSHDEVGI